MMAFVDVERLQAAAFAVGHPLAAVILRGIFAGRVCVCDARGRVAAFCTDHRRMRGRKTARRAARAIRGLRGSDYYRWTVGPMREPEISDAERLAAFHAGRGGTA